MLTTYISLQTTDDYRYFKEGNYTKNNRLIVQHKNQRFQQNYSNSYAKYLILYCSQHIFEFEFQLTFVFCNKSLNSSLRTLLYSWENSPPACTLRAIKLAKRARGSSRTTSVRKSDTVR